MINNDLGFDIPQEFVEFEDITDQHVLEITTKHNDHGRELRTNKTKTLNYVNPALRYISSLDAKSSQKTNINILNNLAKGLGFSDLQTCPWEEINYDVVQLILRRLKDRELSPATINLYLNSIKQTLQHAYDDDLIDNKTLSRIKRIRPIRGERASKGKKIPPESIRALLELCSKGTSIKDIRDAALIIAMRGFGLRRAEVSNLKIENINFNQMTLLIKGKGNKERVVGIPSQIVPILERWIKTIHKQDWCHRSPTYLFMPIHKTGRIRNTKMSDGSVRYILDTRINTAKIDKFAPHDMRRAFATGHLENNIDMSDVQKMMGHADIRTTQKYDLRDKGRLHDIAKEMTIF